MNEVHMTYEDLNVDINTYPPSWSRFLKRCTDLESLVVTAIDQSWIQALAACIYLRRLEIQSTSVYSIRFLATALRTGLPKLDGINVTGYTGWNDSAGDLDMADMLSACCKGWRSIRLREAGLFTVEAVLRHCLTLETLGLTNAFGLTSVHMLRILSCSPRLQYFVTLFEDNYNYNDYYYETTHILAEDFTDADPMTNSLKPRACESTLTIFRAKISGIPRPDITSTFIGRLIKEGMVVLETYPGESQSIQIECMIVWQV